MIGTLIKDELRLIEQQLLDANASIRLCELLIQRYAAQHTPRRDLSPEARKRISLAQKKRWAEHRAARNGRVPAAVLTPQKAKQQANVH